MAHAEPKPLQFRTKQSFLIYLWGLTLLYLFTAIALLVRALEWTQLVSVSQDWTVLAFFLPVVLFLLLVLWMGRWALFHSTAQITVDRDGIAMASRVSNDRLRWEDVKTLHLQTTSGNEGRLAGGGHRVTFPSGSATELLFTRHMEAWIEFRLGKQEIEYDSAHFLGP